MRCNTMCALKLLKTSGLEESEALSLHHFHGYSSDLNTESVCTVYPPGTYPAYIVGICVCVCFWRRWFYVHGNERFAAFHASILFYINTHIIIIIIYQWIIKQRKSKNASNLMFIMFSALNPLLIGWMENFCITSLIFWLCINYVRDIWQISCFECTKDDACLLLWMHQWPHSLLCLSFSRRRDQDCVEQKAFTSRADIRVLWKINGNSASILKMNRIFKGLGTCLSLILVMWLSVLSSIKSIFIHLCVMFSVQSTDIYLSMMFHSKTMNTNFDWNDWFYCCVLCWNCKAWNLDVQFIFHFLVIRVHSFYFNTLCAMHFA